jgi:Domain of unknown function (DUF4170)
LRQPAPKAKSDTQRLHFVFGGELTALDSHEFRDLKQLDIVGVFADYESAFSAWKAAAQKTVDNAMMRYVIVHLHKLLEPDGGIDLASAAQHEANSKP